MRKFRKMIYADHFDKDYLEYEQKKKELEQLAKSAGYDFVPVTAMQTGQKIGYLAGVSGYRETPLPVLSLPPRIGEDMLLFAQATADTIDPALELLKKNRISIGLKAIVTPYNVGWTLSELYQELVKEREKIK